MAIALVDFTKKDLKRLKKLKKFLNLNSMSETISSAIELTDEIIKHKIKGGAIVFYLDDRKQELIINLRLLRFK